VAYTYVAGFDEEIDMLVRSTTRRLVLSTRNGFTLLEVLVVVSILMILAGLAAFAVTRYMRDAKINQAYLQMSKIKSTVDAYYASSGGMYPQSLQELVVPTEAGPPMLEGGESAIIDPWGQPYQLSEEPDSTGTMRIVIFTIFEGQRLQWPRQ
jgi:general secretion pathway protein G